MVLKRPLQISNGFWGDHHHCMFFGGLTIDINGFSMVFDWKKGIFKNTLAVYGQAKIRTHCVYGQAKIRTHCVRLSEA